MARPKSGDKRAAILRAATAVIAKHGLAAAPTSAISKEAGIAEGTLFTYFRTKDDLVNQLYRDLKVEMAKAMMTDFRPNASVREKLQHLWDHYLDWGNANSAKRLAANRMSGSGCFTDETKQLTAAPFFEIQKTLKDAMVEGVINDYPENYLAATLSALAETTLEFMALHPAEAQRYKETGFRVLWSGIARV